MAQGGLITGYGNHKYGPDDQFNIDQMATIIARAKGQPTTPQGGYWAYNAVDYCVNTLKCLPSQGYISADNYSKGTFSPMSDLNRAQAATMFVRAGWTKAATIATEVSDGLTNAQLYNKIKAMGIWTETTDPMGYSNLTAKDAKYGGISIRKTNDSLSICMPEWNDTAWGGHFRELV